METAMTTNSRQLRERLRALVNRKSGAGEVDLAKFKSLRVRLGVTQAEMAELLRVDRTALTGWESGRKRPTPHHAKVLAVLLDEMERLAEGQR